MKLKKERQQIKDLNDLDCKPGDGGKDEKDDFSDEEMLDSPNKTG